MIEIDINPIAFSFGPFHVTWYGMMVALAVLTVVSWGVWQVKKGAGLTYDDIYTAAIVGIPSGIIVSRLLHVIDQAGYYIQNPGRIIGAEGLTIWGGVLGAALGIWIYSLVGKKFKFARFGDVIAPGIILAQAIGRVGCIFNGCCFGLETDLPCAIIYQNPMSYGPIGIPVHPTQFYEIVYDLAVFGVLVSMRNHFKPEGSLFLIYLSLYSLWRLVIELLRPGIGFLFGLHQAQVIAIVVLLVCVPLLAYRTRWVKREAEVKVE